MKTIPSAFIGVYRRLLFPCSSVSGFPSGFQWPQPPVLQLKAMQTVLIRPMARANRYIQNVPINYVHLAAWLREHGHRAEIFDHVFDDVTHDVVDAFIRQNAVRVAGIGCMTCELPQAVEEARRVKQAHPGIIVVFGGAHPSGDPEECLATGVVDYVAVGEGELPLTALLDALEAGRDASEIAAIPG